MRTHHCLTILLATHVVCIRAASAERDTGNKPAANQLFDDAQTLYSRGQIAQACEKYAESHKLDPQLGTLLYLADCYDAMGKTARAWAAFREAVEIAASRQDGRESDARLRLAEIERKLSRLTLDVAPGGPIDMEIRQDGNVVGRALWGAATPVDPGEHTIEATASGFETWTMTVTIAPAETNVHVAVPALSRHPAPPPPSTAPPMPAPPPPVERQAPVTNRSSEAPTPASPRFKLSGYVLAGAGLVSLGIGAVYGLKTNATKDEREDANACSATSSCQPSDQARIDQLTHEARGQAWIANVAFAIGGMALAGGIVLVLTGAQKSAPEARSLALHGWLDRDSAGLGAGGRW